MAIWEGGDALLLFLWVRVLRQGAFDYVSRVERGSLRSG